MSDDDLDALIRRVDPDRWLSSRFIADPEARADVLALYAFDHELARAPKVASNPLIGEMRLAWWREALDEIFEGRAVRRHPTAEALARAVRRRSLPRGLLEGMIDARYRELDATPMTACEAADLASGTAGAAAELAVRILDPKADPAAARAAGAAWLLGRRSAAAPELAAERDRLLAEARTAVRRLGMAAFPAVAHAALARASTSELLRRVRLTWAVVRGRI
jgi:phytoene synthase